MTGRIKIIRKVSSVVDGRRQQEEQSFIPVGARSRVWEQMRNTQPCRPDLKTQSFLRHERATRWKKSD